MKKQCCKDFANEEAQTKKTWENNNASALREQKHWGVALCRQIDK